MSFIVAGSGRDAFELNGLFVSRLVTILDEYCLSSYWKMERFTWPSAEVSAVASRKIGIHPQVQIVRRLSCLFTEVKKQRRC